MADKKISELVAATTIAATDILPIVQTNSTKKVSISTLFNNIPTNIKYSGIKVETGTPDIPTTNIAIDTAISYLVNTTASAINLSLANGIQGQEKTLIATNITANVLVTPTNFANGTSIIFTNTGQTAKLLFVNSKWYILSIYGATVN